MDLVGDIKETEGFQDDGPQFRCAECGNTTRFVTVTSFNGWYPEDYDVQCLECGNLDVEEV